MKKVFFFGVLVSALFSTVSVYGDEKNGIEGTDSEKMEIANKVVNSIDYFDRVTIAFRERYGNLSDREYQVNAKMDFTNGLLDEEFVEKFDDGTIGEQKATLYDKSQDKNLLDINFKEKDYVASEYIYDSAQSKQLAESQSIESRMTKNSVGENVLFQRTSTLPLSMSADAIFSQSYGAQFFSDFNNWSIVGEDTLLGRQAVVAEGNYPKELGEKLKADTFKVWIDKETGIFLKLEGSRDSKVTNYLTVDQIDFDTPVEIRNIENVKKENLTEYKFPVEQQKEALKKQSITDANKIIKKAVQPRIDSYVIDNDPLAGQGEAANSGFSWISNPSAFNGEERYVGNDSSAWYFYSLNGGYTNYQAQAYVCSPRAASTATEYWTEYLSSRIGTLNQNIAACGWNTFRDSYGFLSHLRVNVAHSTNSVADGINFRILN